MELTASEKKLIELVRSAPEYSDLELSKRPTSRNMNGEIVKASVKHLISFEISTQPKKP